MNRAIRRLALVVFAGFGVIVLALSWVQGVAADRYRDDPRNARLSLGQAGRERGLIVSADNVILARSAAAVTDPRSFSRVYPQEDRYAHVVGYASVLFGDTGLEETESATLASKQNSTISGLLAVLTGGDLRAQGLRLTIDDDLQRAAVAALGEQRGAVVAVDPRTGAVLALAASPSFDPNRLVGVDAATAGDEIAADPSRPRVSRAREELYPPGSVFKIVTAAAALEVGAANPATTFPDPTELELPGSTATIRNFDRQPCRDGSSVDLAEGFARSCNTVFGQLGMVLGAETLVAQAEAFGFNADVPFELPVARSELPPASDLADDLPAVAQTALGQRDVRATPLHMALIAAGVANQGTIMAPYVVAETIDADGEVVDTATPAEWRRAVSPATAAVLTELMERVVASGTGRRAAIPGVRVAGKTGTAEVPGSPPHAWFAGFAPVGAAPDERQIAVAVLVESGGEVGEEATGGSVAAPIAATVMAAWLGL